MSVERIRDLNDVFRRSLSGGKVLLTSGVMAEGAARQAEILAAVRAFEAFDDGNDPHGEHGFGAFDIAGARHFWKIDYYDPEGLYGSTNPADPGVTLRVLTIMLADEY